MANISRMDDKEKFSSKRNTRFFFPSLYHNMNRINLNSKNTKHRKYTLMQLGISLRASSIRLTSSKNKLSIKIIKLRLDKSIEINHDGINSN